MLAVIRLALVPLFLTIFLTGLSPSIAKNKKTPDKATADTSEFKDAIEKADALFLDRRDSKKARKALKIYRELHQKYPTQAEIAHRLSMACYFVGIRLTPSQDEKKKIYAEGRDAGLSAIESSTVRRKRIKRFGRVDEKALPESNCAECYFWTAINMALYGQTVGVFKMLFSLNTIQDYLRDSIKLDPTYAYAGAYRLLGKIEHSLPGILGGSNSRSEDYYQAALKHGPDEPLNYLFYANLLDKGFDQPKKALEIAKKGLQVPTPSSDRIESIDSLEKLRKLVKTLEKRLGIASPNGQAKTKSTPTPGST